MLEKKATREVRINFTPAELHDIGRKIAENFRRYGMTEAEKKQSAKKYDAELADIDALINLQAQYLRDEWRYCMREVIVRYEVENGLKYYVLPETGEIVETHKIEPGEQLPLAKTEAKPEPSGELDAKGHRVFCRTCGEKLPKADREFGICGPCDKAQVTAEDAAEAEQVAVQ